MPTSVETCKLLDVKILLQVGNLQELADELQVCGVLAKGFTATAKPRRW